MPVQQKADQRSRQKHQHGKQGVKDNPLPADPLTPDRETDAAPPVRNDVDFRIRQQLGKPIRQGGFRRALKRRKIALSQDDGFDLGQSCIFRNLKGDIIAADRLDPCAQTPGLLGVLLEPLTVFSRQAGKGGGLDKKGDQLAVAACQIRCGMQNFGIRRRRLSENAS